MGIKYNGGNATGNKSTLGEQLNDFLFVKKALIETKDMEYFGQLGDTKSIPKHYGKSLKMYHFLPVLHDDNKNTQGIDAQGTVLEEGKFYAYAKDGSKVTTSAAPDGVYASEAAAETAIKAAATAAKVPVSEYKIVKGGGNLYGGSKVTKVILDNLPLLGEDGGKVNRIGFTRKVIEGTAHNYGVFYAWSREALDFDSQEDLAEFLSRETLIAIKKVNEAVIQAELLAGATTEILCAGRNTTADSFVISSKAGETSIVDYSKLEKLEQALDDIKCPVDTSIVAGSNATTNVQNIKQARYIFISPALESTIRRLKDWHGQACFVDVKDYAVQGSGKYNSDSYRNVAAGEIGAIGGFRFIKNREMQMDLTIDVVDGGGTKVTPSSNAETKKYRAIQGKFEIHNMLVVGGESFAHINLQHTGVGKKVDNKYEIIVADPQEIKSFDDPFSKNGYCSAQWWQGVMIVRPERLGIIKTLAFK